jgi:hypothetical protein
MEKKKKKSIKIEEVEKIVKNQTNIKLCAKVERKEKEREGKKI